MAIGVYFPVGLFRRGVDCVLVNGVERHDYRMFVEQDDGQQMIYFDDLTDDEVASVQLQWTQRPPSELKGHGRK